MLLPTVVLHQLSENLKSSSRLRLKARAQVFKLFARLHAHHCLYLAPLSSFNWEGTVRIL
jgi:hypothetical protein